jgi:hypothetical protein
LIVGYARPGVKVVKGRNVLRFTVVFDLFALLLRRQSLSIGEIVVLGAATAASLAVSQIWILLRYDSDTVNTLMSRCLSMTRTPFRKDGSKFILTIAQRELSVHLASPLPTVGLLSFRGGGWRYTKARLLCQLMGKSLQPAVPRYVVRLGGRHANGA